MVRERWFTLVKEIIAVELSPLGARIANESLDESIDIGVQEKDTASYAFPFRAINGKTVEASIIGWQQEVAVAFAFEKGYLNPANQESLLQFNSALMKTVQDNTRWVSSFGMLLGPAPASIDSFAIALAHYLMNNRLRSDDVSKVISVLENNGAPFLGVLTHIGTAIAFGDRPTAEDLMIESFGRLLW
jgi:hypothetical protein